MDKCWFVLRQTHYAAPEYAKPSKAGGRTTSGDLRLGDIVTSPTALYPLLTQGTLPLFAIDMRISSSRLCEFAWEASSERGFGGTLGAGAPIVGAATGITVGAELDAEFKKTTRNWAEFASLDTEVVQPSRAYIDQLLALPDVQEHIGRDSKARLGSWSVYVVTGLMIARAGGTVGSSEGQSRSLGGGPDVDVAGLVNFKLSTTLSKSTDETRQAQLQGDRIWAVRFAKIHKGLLRSRWTQTAETAGATLSEHEEEAERPSEVLKHEEVGDFEVVEFQGDADSGQRFSFVESGL